MLYLLARNTTPQVIATGGIVNQGQVARRYCKKICGLKAFEFNETSNTLQAEGIYEIIASITFTGAAAGVATFSLAQNGVVIPGATASETITTADTEVRNVTLLGAVLVDENCVLGVPSITAENITVISTGIGVTVTNISISYKKVV